MRIQLSIKIIYPFFQFSFHLFIYSFILRMQAILETDVVYNKAFKNNNTLQPLDQWTNSPFLGQQVGNCKGFTLTHYLADLFAMQCDPRSITLCIQLASYPTHIPFIPSKSNLPILIYSNFNISLENPRSSSWLRSKWVLHPINSHPFHSMLIDPSIPKIQNFLNLTLQIQGEGEMTMILYNYRSRQFHITSNGINPSNGFRDMASKKSGPSAVSFEQFLVYGLVHMGQMG